MPSTFPLPSTTLQPGSYPSSAFQVPLGTTRIEMQLSLPVGDRTDPTVSMGASFEQSLDGVSNWRGVGGQTFTGDPRCPDPGPHWSVQLIEVGGTVFVRGRLDVTGRAVTVGAVITTTP